VNAKFMVDTNVKNKQKLLIKCVIKVSATKKKRLIFFVYACTTNYKKN